MSRHLRGCPRLLPRRPGGAAGGGGSRPGGAAVRQLVDRRAAGLARPGAARTGRSPSGWMRPACMCCWTAPGSRRCRPGSASPSWPGWPPLAPAPPGRPRCWPGPARPWRWSARSTPAGLAGLAGGQFNVGYQLAGQRVTLRMDGTQMAVITSDGELARTMPCPVPAGDRYRLRGARKAAASPLPPSGPVTVQRRVSSRGGIMVATQKIQVGLIHAGKIVTVTAEDHSFRLGRRRAGRRRRAPHHHPRDPPVQGLRGAPAPGKAVTTCPNSGWTP